MRVLFFALVFLSALSNQAGAQAVDLNNILPPMESMATGRIAQLVVLLTVLSVAPGLLIMVTSFTRIIVALSFLRSGMGLQTTPANLILISLALFMTFFVMAPTMDKAWQTGLKPMMENKISQAVAYENVVKPFREFMLDHVREKDIDMFKDLAARSFGTVKKPDPAPGVAPPAPGVAPIPGATPAPNAAPNAAPNTDAPKTEIVDLRVLVPAFMISELRRGFEIGFLIALPFLVIDLIVATITMSMGMMMLPPTVISLPFKILFFVLIDGWNLLVGGLVRSFF